MGIILKPLILAALLIHSPLAFAQTNIQEPTLTPCDAETLQFYRGARGKVRIPTKIQLQRRVAISGDPAIWSTLHKIRVTFPAGDKIECFLIHDAYLESARSIGYDPQLGRLIEVTVLVASGDPEGRIGEARIQLKLRVNQAIGMASLE
jgi:hypothetical protein